MTREIAETSAPIEWLPAEWERFVMRAGDRPFRALQIFRWIHARGVTEPTAMTDLPRALREKLETAGLRSIASMQDIHRAVDGTTKARVQLVRGGNVETVLIPARAQDECDRPDDDVGEPEIATRPVTQCVSTQVGCAMACAFCASGMAGLERSLSASEIVSQYLLGRGMCQPGEQLRNVVYMGMGEPLHAYESTARSLKLLTHRDGADLSTRRVTVSTSGLVPEIDRLGREFMGQIALAVSVHAPTDELRDKLMPINRRYPLRDLVAALRRYPLAPRRRITIEYTLIRDVNDGVTEAKALARLMRGIAVKFNLIPMNRVSGSEFEGSTTERVVAFQNALRDAGYSAFVRRQRGDEITAACGQLVAPETGRRTKVVDPAELRRPARAQESHG